jgi:bacterial/archaeal transporter family-2 protein
MRQAFSLFAIQAAVAVVVGFATSFQPGVNAMFASHAPSRLHGGVLNFLVGFLAMSIVVTACRVPLPEPAKLAEVPWWAWTGGLIGAFFVTMAIVLIKPMGNANYFAAMIFGQFVGSMLIDHFGLLGLPQHPFSWGRAAGLALMGLGVVCIRLW